jgi:hypothetical protein
MTESKTSFSFEGILKKCDCGCDHLHLVSVEGVQKLVPDLVEKFPFKYSPKDQEMKVDNPQYSKESVGKEVRFDTKESDKVLRRHKQKRAMRMEKICYKGIKNLKLDDS